MFIRAWVNIILLMAGAYGSYNVIADQSYNAHAWQYYYYLISPWILLFGSIKAWHRCSVWRRMVPQKNISPELSRGHHKPSKLKQRPSILEYASLILFLMAVAAILKQLKIPNSHWLMGGAWGSYFMLRLAIRVVR